MNYKPIAFAALLAAQACAPIQPSHHQQQKENFDLVTQVVDLLKFNPNTSIKRYDCSTHYKWSRFAEGTYLGVEYQGTTIFCHSLLPSDNVIEVSRVDSTGQRRDFTDFDADGLNGIDTSIKYEAVNTIIFDQYKMGFELKGAKSMDRISKEEQKKERAEYIDILKQIRDALFGKGI